MRASGSGRSSTFASSAESLRSELAVSRSAGMSPSREAITQSSAATARAKTAQVGSRSR
jgi:hypothetical protein